MRISLTLAQILFPHACERAIRAKLDMNYPLYVRGGFLVSRRPFGIGALTLGSK